MVFDFVCSKCNKKFEAEKSCCPECGKEAKKVYSAPGVIFKGKGFYSTDNRRNK